MTIGRWHSASFMAYIKGDRVKRCRVARELQARMSTLEDGRFGILV